MRRKMHYFLKKLLKLLSTGLLILDPYMDFGGLRTCFLLAATKDWTY